MALVTGYGTYVVKKSRKECKCDGEKGCGCGHGKKGGCRNGCGKKESQGECIVGVME